MRLSRAARGPEFQTKTQNEDAYITIPFLQIRQISEMAGAACQGEGYQCPARWMSLTSIASNMSFPVVVPRNGTSWRNSSHTFRSAVTPRMKTASWAVSFMSVLSLRAREKATRVEMRVFSESCTLSDISSIRQRTARDERLTFSKTERCSGQTESTTATRHSLMKSPSENGFIRRARMRETS